MTNLKITDKTGRVAAVRSVNGTRELIIISMDGIVLRTTVDTISSIGRNTQGVSIMRLRPTDTVAAIAGIEGPEDEAPAPRRRRGAEDGGAPAERNGKGDTSLLPGFEEAIRKAPPKRGGRNGTA